MSKHNAVNWFEIPVKNLERAQKFYEDITGLKLQKNKMGELDMAWFPMEQNVPGSTGALVHGKGYEPSQSGSVVYISVPGIEGALDSIEKKGGKVITQKTSIGEYGFVAHFEDSEGNRVALHSEK